MKIKGVLFLWVIFLSHNIVFSQVQRTLIGKSVIREHIILYDEFNFTRDWNKIAQFKSGIGETVDLFPIIFRPFLHKFRMLWSFFTSINFKCFF